MDSITSKPPLTKTAMEVTFVQRGLCRGEYQNITTQRILLEKCISAHPSKTGGCKGMFSILCMHFFIAYQARIT